MYPIEIIDIMHMYILLQHIKKILDFTQLILE